MPTSISVATLEAAAEAEYEPFTAAGAGLTPLLGATGAQLSFDTNGCVGSAWMDDAGQVIVAYQGTTSSPQTLADAEVLTGNLAPAPGVASAFASQVESVAAADGIASTDVYVTGHSLGGVLAEAAAESTGLAGASFAGAGLPGYVAPATGVASDFVSYVEAEDPFANYATGSGESALVSDQSHYGTVVTLGGASTVPASIVADVRALLPALLHGRLAAATATLETEWTAGMSAAHGLAVYQAAIAALPPAEQTVGYGVAPAELAARIGSPVPLVGHVAA